jgi:hypothetical protein
MSHKLDEEFKLFMRWRGFNIDSGLFTLEFNPPQNFAAYRQSELDNARVSTFSTMEQYPYIAKRFALQRFLGLTEEEIKENEKLWREEQNKDKTEEPKGSDLRNIGVSVGDIEADQDAASDLEAAGTDEQVPGMEVTAPVAGGTPGEGPGPQAAPGQI